VCTKRNAKYKYKPLYVAIWAQSCGTMQAWRVVTTFFFFYSFIDDQKNLCLKFELDTETQFGYLFSLLLSWIVITVIASRCIQSIRLLRADCCVCSLKMVVSLVKVLSQHYMWTWIQEFALGLAKLNKQVYGIFKDNIQAESCLIQETYETRQLVDLWSEDEMDRCEGCDDRCCYWCAGWSRKVIASDSSPEWSDAYSDNS
jgi:hypothetical protein